MFRCKQINNILYCKNINKEDIRTENIMEENQELQMTRKYQIIELLKEKPYATLEEIIN